MEEQRKERTIDELAAENDALRKKADELNKEIEYLQQQVNFLKKSVFGSKSEKKVLSQLIRERKSAAVLRYWGICLSKKLFMRLRTRPVTDAAAK